ncbi:UNVERIFIED_CONTAM: hypothetical protein GTU68_015469 [Idotea baltica]|nr:hypothetical protein [Idotea baltica]
MFLRAANEGLIDPERSVQVGIRTSNDSTHGFTILTSPFVHREGIPATLGHIRRVIGDSPTYLTFDIDCLDPAFAPGTGTPVPGGLTSLQALEIMRGLVGMNLVGFDVVEVAPAYDNAEITAIAAATIAQEMLGLLAIGKGAQARDLGDGFFN